MTTSPLAISPPAAASAMSAHAVFGRRVIGAVVALCAAALLTVAAWLEPSPTGLGTHQQLHMPQCGWIIMFDTPCPTCGMTTAFAHAADGHLWASFRAQPLGCLLAVTSAMALLLGSYVAATGSRVAGGLAPLWRPRMGWVIAAMVLLAWGYKVLSHKGVL